MRYGHMFMKVQYMILRISFIYDKIITYMVFIHVNTGDTIFFLIKLILIIWSYGCWDMKEVTLYYYIFSLKCFDMSTHWDV